MHKNDPMLMSILATLVVACAATAPVASAGIRDFILPKHDVRVITMTDMTPAGASRPPVSRTHPSYYVAINGGYRDLGGIIGGDKIPPQEEAIRTIAKVLAEQGYLPATNEHRPSLILVLTWGTLYPDFQLMSDGGEVTEVQVNQGQMLRFLGGYKLGLITEKRDFYEDSLLLSEWRFRNPESTAIFELMTETLFAASITAFDFAEAKRGEKVLLWKTKISCPSVGLRMDQTLPTMLALAAPHIGRETMKPVSINATDKFKGEVKIGDPTVIEYIDQPPLIVIDAPARESKKPKERSQPEEGKSR